MTIFTQKKKLDEIRGYTIRNLQKDYSLSRDINIAFDDDPPRDVIVGLLEIFSLNAQLSIDLESEIKTYDEFVEDNREEIDRRNEIFYLAASQLVIDVDVEGILFDTPENAEKALENETDLPWGLLYEAIGLYIDEMLETHDRLKKIINRALKTLDSGEINNNEEEE